MFNSVIRKSFIILQSLMTNTSTSKPVLYTEISHEAFRPMNFANFLSTFYTGALNV